MKPPKSLLLTTAALLSPFTPSAIYAQTQPVSQASVSEDQRLAALFAADDEASLKRNPLNALFRGDMRYADRLGDYISDEYFAGERKAAEDNLESVNGIDRAKLNPTDQIAYDVYKQRNHGPDRGSSDQPLFRLSYFLPHVRQRQGCGSVQNRRRL
jgi:uncharacterized protein (DUF885 family)